MQHDSSVVGKAPLFLVTALTDMVRSATVISARCSTGVNVCRIGAPFAATNAKSLVAAVSASPRVVMVLSEYLRYVLAGNWPDGTASFL